MDTLFRAHKLAEKVFRKKLKKLSKEYDDQKIDEAIKKAELDRNVFWKMLKRERDGPKVKTPSIKNKGGKVVHEVRDILNVWRNHFSNLGTPVESDNFDNNHYVHVNTKIQEWLNMDDIDEFSESPITVEEVRKGVRNLNTGKAPGSDGITKEHIVNAGPSLYNAITMLFNWIRESEYIPVNFRRGIQIPLYKGKNSSILDVNNYRGITLLSIFNKLFEVVLWKRIEPWWVNNGVISQQQGACRKGLSCVHSAYVLQESISTLLETHKKVFVTYLDVTKAFDGVWIGGLFYRLREIGIKGKTWRMLYNTYVDFKCRVRIQDELSEWYPLRCGIHQGGYLSLIKYLAFIDSLLVLLEGSRTCSIIYDLSVSPLGYADDVAAACTSKSKTDRMLDIVYTHSQKWRYNFNPKKSSVLVYGEKENENLENSKYRTYKLGNDRIKEETSYDHLGLKNNVFGKSQERTMEKVSKGRKALNAASGLGLKQGGLTIRACSLLFWSMVVPIITFASELWVMKDEDCKIIEDFEVYAGRRIQRFHPSSPRETSYVSLGWIRLEIYIYIYKEDIVYKNCCRFKR